jgi:ATP-dependent RNA helicase DeaD
MIITFDKLNLSDLTLKAISRKNFKVASEIQEKIIPLIFEKKKDIIGIAQTGTGKTGAFGLPLIDLINEGNKFAKAIILAPTRELAIQVKDELNMFSSYKKLNILTVYGGSSINNQIKSLRRGVDIIVGTPGRVLDLINKKELSLADIEYLVLDEADEMLKMGFIEDIEYILENSSKKKRVYLFSATMPDRIKKLSKKYMKNQIIVEVKKKIEINNLIEQSFYKIKQSEKFNVLSKLIEIEDFFYGIVFCRTKLDVDSITSLLKKKGHSVDCIHGDIVQNKREKILNKFRDLKLNILVATDVAARGIDIPNLSHVINFNFPEDLETYTHRIGRTGRAGNKGKAISLCTQGEMRRISMFEKELKTKIISKKIPSDKELRSIKHKKIIVEIDGFIENYDVDKHLNLADQLLKKHKPEKVISALLHKIHNEENFNSQINDFEKVRLFVAKGRMDKIDRKGLIRFLERESNVKIGDVDEVKICEKFSFLTMNSREASKIVEHFESINRRRPLVEVAQK